MRINGDWRQCDDGIVRPEALDVCVLGRDITGMFAVIVDHPANTVCLLRGGHRYAIEQT